MPRRVETRRVIRRALERVVAACLVASLVLGSALGQSGWVVSPTTVIPGARFSVLGGTPGCSGGTEVASEVRRAVEGFGVRSPEAGSEPSRLSLSIGRLLNGLGLDTMNQDFAECVEVCATVPLTATRVTSLLPYVTYVGNQNFISVPFDRFSFYVHWEPDVDTTSVTEAGRLVCATVRNWAQDSRRAFLVVGYE